MLLMKAAIQPEYRSSVCNLRDTGHSIWLLPTAAKADKSRPTPNPQRPNGAPTPDDFPAAKPRSAPIACLRPIHGHFRHLAGERPGQGQGDGLHDLFEARFRLGHGEVGLADDPGRNARVHGQGAAQDFVVQFQPLHRGEFEGLREAADDLAVVDEAAGRAVATGHGEVEFGAEYAFGLAVERISHPEARAGNRYPLVDQQLADAAMKVAWAARSSPGRST